MMAINQLALENGTRIVWTVAVAGLGQYPVRLLAAYPVVSPSSGFGSAAANVDRVWSSWRCCSDLGHRSAAVVLFGMAQPEDCCSVMADESDGTASGVAPALRRRWQSMRSGLRFVRR